MDKQLYFKDLNIGDKFDFIDPISKWGASYFQTCVKTSKRGYVSEDGAKHTVGSINCRVYHVERKEDDE